VCGFLGLLTDNSLNVENLASANNYMTCRGPDSTKVLQDSNKLGNLYLSFNRLKIIDLSDDANQPMLSNNQKNTLMFNGEIYNHRELRKDLISKGVTFKTDHSDSEVVLNGISYYGIDYVNQLRGQFAISFIDQTKSKLFLAVDRLGQKPLYYHTGNKEIGFSSNLQTLKKIFNRNINSQSLNEYLRYGVVSSPNTILEGIFKLEPSTILEIDLSNKSIINKRKYWELENFVDNKKFSNDEFFSNFDEAVAIRSVADVPVANFLSGGIDSTSIIKNMIQQEINVNSFSVHLDNEKYDESTWSNQVSSLYNTNHSSITISTDLNIDEVNSALECLDEPYADPSVVPSFFLSKEISKKYKVAISGDGGDELLGGYERIQNSISKNSIYDNFLSKLYFIYPNILGTGNYFLSKSKNINQAYSSYFEDDKFLNLLGINKNKINKNINLISGLENYKALLVQDYKYYLPEMMMFKVDRTSMQNSLEVRSPFVDHKLVEYVLSTSSVESLNMNKNVLKKYLLNDFTEEFVYRKKAGFIFDLEGWVSKNSDFVYETLQYGKINDYLNLKKINLLTLRKSRMNANRIWKLYVLENYLTRI